MKVLMACQNHPDPYNPYWGTFIQRSIDSIVKSGVETEAIIPRPYSIPIEMLPYSHFSKLPLSDSSGLYHKHYPRYFYFPPKKLFYGSSGDSYLKHVTKYAKKHLEAPDVIHAHHVYMDGYGMTCLSKEWEVPLVMVEHGTILKMVLNWKSMHNKIIKTLNCADHIMCVSSDLLSIALKNGISEDKLSLVPIGVDIEIFRKKDSTNLKNLLGIDLSTNIVLYVGRLVPLKGLKYLINAIPSILRKNPNTLFVFAGQGSQRKELESLCSIKNILKNVSFLGGINSKKLVDWYSVSDIFVLPSLSEGRPTVIYEAMSCEVPVVASDVGGIPEQVKNGYNGYVVPPKDSKSLADKINYLLLNKDLAKELGKNGRKRIIDEGWDWAQHAQNVYKVYKKCL